MTTSGPGFAMTDFLASISHTVRPDGRRPLVVHDGDLEEIPPGAVPNPTSLRIAGLLPTATFELFRQVIPAGESSDPHRHHHDTAQFGLTVACHTDSAD